eukprot:356240-Chlamydomonas_euryale.AAC.3
MLGSGSGAKHMQALKGDVFELRIYGWCTRRLWKARDREAGQKKQACWRLQDRQVSKACVLASSGTRRLRPGSPHVGLPLCRFAALPTCWFAGLLVFWSAGWPVGLFAGLPFRFFAVMLVCRAFVSYERPHMVRSRAMSLPAWCGREL